MILLRRMLLIFSASLWAGIAVYCGMTNDAKGAAIFAGLTVMNGLSAFVRDE